MDFAITHISSAIFLLFAGVMILSALAVVCAKNPVHSVLFLILTFFNAAALFVLIGAEYLAMTLVVVYVGAVAVLFLFVVMMLNINFAKLRAGFLSYLPIGGLVALILFVEMVMMLFASTQMMSPVARAAQAIPAPEEIDNVKALGMILYTDYFVLFQLSGMILLVAMIGAIVLTLRTREGVRRQTISEQVNRKRSDSIEMVDVPTGEGAS